MAYYINFQCTKCDHDFKVLVESRITKTKTIYKDSETGLVLKKGKSSIPGAHYLITKCNWCGKKATDKCTVKSGDNFGKWKSPTIETRLAQEKFERDGMPKEWAENFYKDSIQASKERIKTMGEVYKKVDPHIPTLVKQGRVKPTKNVTKRMDYLKDINRELHKMAKKDPNPKK